MIWRLLFLLDRPALRADEAPRHADGAAGIDNEDRDSTRRAIAGLNRLQRACIVTHMGLGFDQFGDAIIEDLRRLRRSSTYLHEGPKALGQIFAPVLAMFGNHAVRQNI